MKGVDFTPGVNKEQIAKAKEIDLLSYLQANEPHELIKAGPNEYRTATHGSLVISNGLWHWVNGGFGGKSALDYLVRVRGLGFVNAVETLCGVRASPSFSIQPVNTPVKPPFTLPPANANEDRVMAYLRGRGIDADIIDACIKNGGLYESEKNHNCVFVGYDINDKPRFACMRGTFGDFKQDVAGSDKRHGYCLSVSEGSRGVCVTEAPADALSAAALLKLKGEPWEKYYYLSLGGTSPLALLQFLSDRPEVNHVTLLLDNDPAGREGTRRIIEAIQGDAGLAGRITDISDRPPGHGKDYNEQLQQFLREQKSTSCQSRRRAAISL